MAAASELRRPHPVREMAAADQRLVPLGARRLPAGSPAFAAHNHYLDAIRQWARGLNRNDAVVWLIEQMDERAVADAGCRATKLTGWPPISLPVSSDESTTSVKQLVWQ